MLKNKVGKILMIMFVGVVLVSNIFIFSGCFSTDEDVVLQSSSISCKYNEYLGYEVFVSGVVKNVGEMDCDYVEIEFSLYNSAGEKIGTTWTNVSGLKAGESWRFQTITEYLDERVVSYELSEITSW